METTNGYDKLYVFVGLPDTNFRALAHLARGKHVRVLVVSFQLNRFGAFRQAQDIIGVVECMALLVCSRIENNANGGHVVDNAICTKLFTLLPSFYLLFPFVLRVGKEKVVARFLRSIPVHVV